MVESDMECPICQADVYDTANETYQLVRWNPATQGNELVVTTDTMAHMLQWLVLHAKLGYLRRTNSSF